MNKCSALRYPSVPLGIWFHAWYNLASLWSSILQIIGTHIYKAFQNYKWHIFIVIHSYSQFHLETLRKHPKWLARRIVQSPAGKNVAAKKMTLWNTKSQNTREYVYTILIKCWSFAEYPNNCTHATNAHMGGFTGRFVIIRETVMPHIIATTQ